MIEQLIKYIAPHLCIACDMEGSLWCTQCRLTYQAYNLRCYICRQPTSGPLVLCYSCVDQSPFVQVFAATRYVSTPKELVHLLKFERAKEAADTIARYMAETIALPQLDMAVVPVPTATTRVRSRGYDQAALIARALARYAGYAYAPLLIRQGQKRQVGRGREERKRHSGMGFRVMARTLPNPKHPVLLIDDVITTGSTLKVAQGVLAHNGFNHIYAAVFAAA